MGGLYQDCQSRRTGDRWHDGICSIRAGAKMTSGYSDWRSGWGLVPGILGNAYGLLQGLKCIQRSCCSSWAGFLELFDFLLTARSSHLMNRRVFCKRNHDSRKLLLFFKAPREPKRAIPVNKITGGIMSDVQPIIKPTDKTMRADEPKIEFSVQAICEDANLLGCTPI